MMPIPEKHFWNSGKLLDHFWFLVQNQFFLTQFVLNQSLNHSQKPKVINLSKVPRGQRGQIVTRDTNRGPRTLKG